MKLNTNKQIQKAISQYYSIKHLQFHTKKDKIILKEAWLWMIAKLTIFKNK